MRPLRATVARLLDAIASGWRAGADPPAAKRRSSWFDADPDTLRASLPLDPDAQEADAWYRTHFKVNGQPWDARR